MLSLGDNLPGDIIIATHICAHGSTSPHEPVPFMGSPVDMGVWSSPDKTDSVDSSC